jgi:tetratricopeptide (TPR) repeat protein/predicted Ser/Thr protein kinase
MAWRGRPGAVRPRDSMTSESVGPYTIIAPIGAGGMGEVYLAEDTRLHRKVALKTLTGDATTPERRARLLHEARAAATLSHPAIAAVYDVVDEGTRAWLVMEYVEGETLGRRLARGPLPVAEAIALATTLLDGVAEAHRRGILHRDLKPSNLMITPGGSIKILDFGVARIRIDGEAATRTGGPYTAAQSVIGSPGYMAPEQLAGRPIDARADLYSAGVVLSEMLSGARGVPPELDAAIDRAMEHDPQKRFASAGQMRAAIVQASAGRGRVSRVLPRAFAAIAVAAALVGGASLYRSWHPRIVAGEGARRVIAVPPLDNLTGDRGKDYLAAGIAETIGATLARQAGLVVIPRSEIARASNTGRTARELAAELSAGYVVTGDIQQAGDILQVALTLLRADGSTEWSDRDRDSVAQVFALEDRIAGRLAQHFNGARTRASLPTPTPDALAAYWEGRALLEKRNVEGNVDRAIAQFEHAIAIDPQFALAHGALGEAFWSKYTSTKDASWTIRATQEGARAVDLDPDNPDAHVSLAVTYRGAGRLDDAIAQLTRALELQKEDAEAHRVLAGVLADRGDVDGAVAEMHRAIAIRPGYWVNYDDLGTILSDASRYREAVAAYGKVVALQPDKAWGFSQLGSTYQLLGDTDRAMANLERAAALGASANVWSSLGTLYYGKTRYADAERAFRRASEMKPNSAIYSRNLGDVYTKLGRPDDARTAYLRAIALAQADLRVNPNDAVAMARLAVYEAKVHRARDAEQHIRRAEMARGDLASVQFRKAVVYALLNQPAVAIEAATAAVSKGYPMAQLRDEDDLQSLRSHPRFAALVKPESKKEK